MIELNMIFIVIICTSLLVPNYASEDETFSEAIKTDITKKEKYLMRTFDWIGENVLGFIENLISEERQERSNVVEGITHNL